MCTHITRMYQTCCFVCFIQIQGWLWFKTNYLKKMNNLHEKIRRDYIRRENRKMLH